MKEIAMNSKDENIRIIPYQWKGKACLIRLIKIYKDKENNPQGHDCEIGSEWIFKKGERPSEENLPKNTDTAFALFLCAWSKALTTEQWETSPSKTKINNRWEMILND